MYALDVDAITGPAAAADLPEPGGRAPAPAPGLHEVQDFVNTNDIEGERDRLATPELLGEWLAARGALPRGARVTADAHARAIAVREGLRALGRANNDEPLEADQVDAMNRAARQLPLVAGLGDGSAWHLEGAAGSGVDRYLAGILANVVHAMADGSWSRVKACRNDGCRWLFFDSSRNRSGTWCTMAICGSRMKARSYRARRARQARPIRARSRATTRA
jgi:predicted RNA-binding Zn ribbon-like protein